MGRITKDALQKRAAEALPREMFVDKETGDEYLVQGMSGRQRDEWEKTLIVRRRGGQRDVNTDNVRASLVCRCLINDDGTRVLADDDEEWLGNLRASVLTKLYALAQKLSGVGDSDIEELGKPSGETVGSGSRTS